MQLYYKSEVCKSRLKNLLFVFVFSVLFTRYQCLSLVCNKTWKGFYLYPHRKLQMLQILKKNKPIQGTNYIVKNILMICICVFGIKIFEELAPFNGKCDFSFQPFIWRIVDMMSGLEMQGEPETPLITLR